MSTQTAGVQSRYVVTGSGTNITIEGELPQRERTAVTIVGDENGVRVEGSKKTKASDPAAAIIRVEADAQGLQIFGVDTRDDAACSGNSRFHISGDATGVKVFECTPQGPRDVSLGGVSLGRATPR